jgi:DNA polymerase
LAAGADSLEALRDALAALDSPLRDTAGKLVLSDGVAESGLVLIGEAPGADEDRQGRPFVGVSGQLLDRMLASVGIERTRNAYLTNILPWRPPGNRTPTDSELALFTPFVMRHLALVRPRHVVLLGGTSAKALLRRNEGITRLRGRWHSLEVPGLGNVPTLATLHPAYLLRQPGAKRDSWADLRLLRRALDDAGPAG